LPQISELQALGTGRAQVWYMCTCTARKPDFAGFLCGTGRYRYFYRKVLWRHV